MDSHTETIPNKWVINPQNTMQVVAIKIIGNFLCFYDKCVQYLIHFYNISVHLHTQLMIQDIQITLKITVNHMVHQQTMELLHKTLPIQLDNTIDHTEIMVSSKVLNLIFKKTA